MDEMKKALDDASSKWEEARKEMDKALIAYYHADFSDTRAYARYRTAEDAYYYAYEYYKGLSRMYTLACRHMAAIDEEREAHGI